MKEYSIPFICIQVALKLTKVTTCQVDQLSVRFFRTRALIRNDLVQCADRRAKVRRVSFVNRLLLLLKNQDVKHYAYDY